MTTDNRAPVGDRIRCAPSHKLNGRGYSRRATNAVTHWWRTRDRVSKTKERGYRSGDRGQRTEDRGQRTIDREQWIEDSG